MTIYFTSAQITIYRHRQIGSANRFAMSATYTAYNADIQPASPDRAIRSDGGVNALFDAWVDSSVDIKEGDQVVDSNGKRYSVKGVENWSGAGLLDHKMLLLGAQDA